MGGSAEKGVRGGQEHRQEHETRAWRLGLPEGICCPVRQQRRGTKLELLSPHHVILATPRASLHRCQHSPTQPPNGRGGRMAMRLGETKRDDRRRLLCCIVQC